MDAVVVGAGPDQLAERRRLGQDRFDEVWNGAYHVVPSPSDEHQRLAGELFVVLYPLAAAAGLAIRYELNLFGPLPATDRDYRVPDLIVFDPALASDRGVHGPAHLVVEVASPGDESLAKLPFYEQVGVVEVVIVDRDTKAVRRWVRRADRLVEAEAEPGGIHRAAALPVELGGGDGELLVATAAGRRRI